MTDKRGEDMEIENNSEANPSGSPGPSIVFNATSSSDWANIAPPTMPCTFCVCEANKAAKVAQSLSVCGCPCHWQNTFELGNKLEAVGHFFYQRIKAGVRNDALEEAAKVIEKVEAEGYDANDGTIHKLHDRFGLFPGMASMIRKLKS